MSICYNFYILEFVVLLYFFFKCIKLHHILSQFSTITFAQVLDIIIFEGDYSNLNNPFLPKTLISSTYTRFMVENRENICCNKKGLLPLHFLKKYPTYDFFKFSAKRVLCTQVYIFNKVQKPDEVVT